VDLPVKGRGVVELPEKVGAYTVTEIYMYAFINCKLLTSITIPGTVRRIGEKAFYGCSSLTSIDIPNSVEEIDYSAFEGCSSLAKVRFEDGPTSISVYYGGVFNGAPLDEVYVGRNGSWGLANSLVKKVILGEGVTSINYPSLENCSALTSISIPHSVNSIDDLGFAGCSSLSSITIPNSVSHIGYYVFERCN